MTNDTQRIFSCCMFFDEKVVDPLIGQVKEFIEEIKKHIV
jgi:hypothetical protein